MRSYIAYSSGFDPIIPCELHNYIVAKYVEKRKFQREDDSKVGHLYVTPRTLLGIIRLSQSLAKFNLRLEVTQTDVDIAVSLMDYSISSLNKFSEDDKELKSWRKFIVNF